MNEKDSSSQPMQQSEQILCALSKSPKALSPSLSGLGFSKVELSGENLIVMSIESQDMGGKALQFMRAEFSEGCICLSYTSENQKALALRRLKAVQWLLRIIGASGASAEISPQLAAIVYSALDGAISSISPPQEKLLGELFEIRASHKKLLQKYSSLSAEHEAMAKRLFGASAKLEAASTRLLKLSELPDEALDDEVMAHLRVHGGKIAVKDFVSSSGAGAAQVEASLQRLSRGGYIARED